MIKNKYQLLKADMKITPYHAKYYAQEITKQYASGDLQKFARSLMDARVDLNPHQIEAALFAFRSPFSKGAILADEVGLGKTIEAGILLSQKWAERKRKILIILPSNLRKQWNQELLDKFYLPSTILEAKNFNNELKSDTDNPFDRKDEIILCSYHFARNKADFIQRVTWDLVIIDEAHRLRNVYKTDNKIGKRIKEAIARSPKVLLTATPLQNNLLELYGLVSLIDEQVFGDLKSFKAQFSRPSDAEFGDLKKRISPLCQRTLRKQVLEYIQYTKRIPITQEFFPSPKEHQLYEDVSAYLQRDELYALPKSQRHLMTLILRKLLASSSFAISNTLARLIDRLEKILKDGKFVSDNPIDEDDYEEFEEIKDEWDVSDEEEEIIFTENDRINISAELEALKKYHTLALSIQHNAKGEALEEALEKGFTQLKSLGALEKAMIFTESTRTQNYLFELLSKNQDYKGKIVLFNGSNNDEKSKEIYKNYLEKYSGTDKITGSKTADVRAALVDYFKNEGVIMIATEAAAEGINLQFCSLIVNYDLPWNPQRIEQRIGRCHRYGQKFDVVVVNFLNKKNAADERVYQLLKDKFKLFDGVFGASDDVLGTLESGVDFEKRIIEIYQQCRTTEEIQMTFDDLQKEMEEQIASRMDETRENLLEHFDQEVSEKLRVNLEASKIYLDASSRYLWNITKFFLQDSAQFETEEYKFHLTTPPEKDIPHGGYHMNYQKDEPHHYRLGCQLAQWVINQSQNVETKPVHLSFKYSETKEKISILEEMLGESGTLQLVSLSVQALEKEDYLVFSATASDGKELSQEQCYRLFSLEAQESDVRSIDQAQLEKIHIKHKAEILENVGMRNSEFFDLEVEKLDKWAEDLKKSLEIRLKELEKEIKTQKTEARKIQVLEKKVKAQRSIKELEKKRSEIRQKLFQSQDEIDQRKEVLLDDIEKRLEQNTEEREVFTISWDIK